MKVNDLIEFLEYSDRQALVVVGIANADGRVLVCDDVLFLKHERRVCLIVDPNHQSRDEAGEIRLDEYQRTQLFGHDFVLLGKPPEQTPQLPPRKVTAPFAWISVQKYEV
jgi:hypothetical protein